MITNPEWSAKELHLLTKYYDNMSNDELAIIIGRTPSAIAHKAHKLKMKKSEEFLASPASGRYQPVLTVGDKIRAWIQPINPFYRLRLEKFRRNIKEGDRVLVRLNKYRKTELIVFVPFSKKFVTVHNPKIDQYERYSMSDVFPPKSNPTK